MKGIRFSRLVEVATDEVMSFLNDPSIARHMPLAGDRFDEVATRQWVESKDGQWERNGYGPWAVHVADEFAGWCGFQQEGADADFGMVLMPRFWGAGKHIYRAALSRGFQDFHYESIVVTLPPTRKVSRVLQRLGFRSDGETEYWGNRFLRFRLSRTDWLRFASRAETDNAARELRLDDLVTRFVATTIPREEWTHAAHLAVGLWHVHEYGGEGALERLRHGIRALNDRHGTPNTDTSGYHETITVAYVRLLEQFLAKGGSDSSLESRLRDLLRGPLADGKFLGRFWSRDVLMSPAARRSWMPPDLGPLTLSSDQAQ